MSIERIFQITSVLLAAAAGYLFWIGQRDYTFVAAVLACTAFFLSIRFQVKERNKVREAERELAADSENAE
jgi:hypothetical protein